MNPKIIFSVARVAYDNREVATNLLSKIKAWRTPQDQASDEELVSMSPEDRLDRLERSAETKELIEEEQSELISGLADNVAELSTTTQALLARTKVLIWLIVISLCLSATALITSLIQ